MNLSTRETVARNLFAALTGITDPDTVEFALSNPAVSSVVDRITEQVVAGPFGTLDADDDDDIDQQDEQTEGLEALLGQLFGGNVRVVVI